MTASAAIESPSRPDVSVRSEAEGFRGDIEGLRGLAVLAVIAFHADQSWLAGGYLGVDVFFVISGYLITAIIAAALAKNSFRAADFYLRRARRIVPALVLLLLCSAPFCLNFLLPDELRRAGIAALTSLGFVSNFYYLADVNYFDAGGVPRPFLHTWSLSVEAQFYLVFPWLLLLLRPMGPRLATAALGGLALLSFVAFALPGSVRPLTAFYMFPFRAWEFLAGALLAQLSPPRASERPLRVPTAWLGEVLALGGLAMLVVALTEFGNLNVVRGLPNALAVAGTVAVMAVPSSLPARLVSLRPLRLIGLISYSLYLVHYPIICLAQGRRPANAPLENPLLIGALIAVGSLALFMLFEKPLRGGGRPGRPDDWAIGAAATVVAAMAGAVAFVPGVAESGTTSDDAQLLVSRSVRNDFTWSRMKALQSKRFIADDPRPKVLVIGDSFAGDLLNAVFSASLDEGLQFSTVTISSRCGNLYTDENLTALQTPSGNDTCEANIYLRADVQRRLRQADQIWLISAWRSWQAERLQASIDRLISEFGHPIVVFGRKSMGPVDLAAFLDLSVPDRIARTLPVPEGDTALNGILAGLRKTAFVNTQLLICGSQATCHPFDAAGRLLAYDGGHLTNFGAEKLGAALRDDPAFQAALAQLRPDVNPR